MFSSSQDSFQYNTYPYIALSEVPNLKLEMPIQETKIVIAEEKKPIVKKYKNRQSILSLLEEQQNEIERGKSLVKKVTNQRKRPIRWLMYAIMIGSGIYIFYQAVRAGEYNQLEDERIFNEKQAFLDHINFLKNERINLTSQYWENFKNVSAVQKLREAAFDVLNRTTYSWVCHMIKNPEQSYNVTYPCLSRLDMFQTQHACYDNYNYNPDLQIPYHKCLERGGWVDGASFNDDLCDQTIKNYCSITISYLWKEYFLNKAADLINQLQKNVNGLYNEMAALHPDYEAFYDSFGGIVLYFLLTVGFGELSPGVVIALTFITHLGSNWFARCWSLEENEANEVIATAEKNEIKHNKLKSYSTILDNFDERLAEIYREKKKYNNKNKPLIKQLNLVLHEIGLTASSIGYPIFDYLGFNFDVKHFVKDEVNSILTNIGVASSMIYIIFDYSDFNFETKLLSRNRFELGAHPKNAQEIINPNGTSAMNSLFKFFNRLHDNKPENENNKIEVLANIYQYAGWIPAGSSSDIGHSKLP